MRDVQQGVIVGRQGEVRGVVAVRHWGRWFGVWRSVFVWGQSVSRYICGGGGSLRRGLKVHGAVRGTGGGSAGAGASASRLHH